MMRINHQVNNVLILAVIGIYLSACSSRCTNQEPQETPISTQFVFVQDSAVVFTTIGEITSEASIIIIGHPTNEEGVINTARDSDDPSKPHADLFGIGQVYNVAVDSYLIGDGPNTLYVVQHHGHILLLGSQELTESDFEQARQRENIIPLSLNENYIMFLKPASDTYVEFQPEYYFGVAHPWRFEITDTGCVQPIDEEGESLYIYFPSQPLDEFLQFINSPGYFPTLPYPAPISPSRCPTESITTYP